MPPSACPALPRPPCRGTSPSSTPSSAGSPTARRRPCACSCRTPVARSGSSAADDRAGRETAPGGTSSTRRAVLAGLGAAGGVLSLPGLARAIQDTTSSYRRPRLKITDVRTAQVLAHGHQVHVRVYTDQGLIGQGEATDSAVGTPPLIQGPLKRMLVGQDPLNVDHLFERLRTLGIFAGAQGGQYVTALTGIEIALWDLAGKALGLPVYQLLGGKMRDKIRVYCDSQTE